MLHTYVRSDECAVCILYPEVVERRLLHIAGTYLPQYTSRIPNYSCLHRKDCITGCVIKCCNVNGFEILNCREWKMKISFDVFVTH
jgi:hypothetical protein